MRFHAVKIRIMQMVSNLAFSLARSKIGRLVVGVMFSKMSFALPVQRLIETSYVIAFRHPRPSYPLHILIVPKSNIESLNSIKLTDADLLVDLFQVVQNLVAEFDLEKSGYRLIANGGEYQEIPQLHFHLISEDEQFL